MTQPHTRMPASPYDWHPFPTLTLNEQGEVRGANGPARALLSIDRGHLSALAPARHGAELREALEEAAREGAAERWEIPLYGVRGQHVIAALRIIRIRDAYGQASGYVCSVIDQTGSVSQRQALEATSQRLSEELEHYRLLADLSLEWACWVDEGGQLRYVSPACRDITGYTAQEFLDDPSLMQRIIHPDDQGRYGEHRHASSEERPDSLRFRITTRAGDVRWIEHNCRAVWDEAGRYRGYRIANRDITTVRREVAESLRRNEEALAYVLDTVPDIAVQGYQLDGTVVLWNRASEYLYGYSAEEAMGANLADLLIPPEERESFLHRLQGLREGGSLPPSEILVLRHKRGYPVTVFSRHVMAQVAEDDLRLYCMDVDINARDRDRERLWEVVQGGNLGLFEWRPDGYVFFSREFKGQLGYKDRELGDDLEAWLSLIHPDEREAVRELFSVYARHPSGRFRSEVRVRHRAGEWRWILYQGTAIYTSEGQLEKLLGSSLDITERRQAEERSARLAYAVEQSPALVMITDQDNVIEYVNQSFCEVTGFSRDEVVGYRPGILRYGEENVENYQRLWDTIREGEIWEGEFKNRKRCGDPYLEQARIAPVRDASGRVTHYVKLAEDITDKRALTERLEYLAFHDSLTGLPNRSLLLDRIGQAVLRSRRKRHSLAVVFIDLDDFKAVNDSLGHTLGDELLVQVAQRLSRVLRAEDTVARFGGDEFIVLLPSLEHESAVLPVLHRLQTTLGEPMPLSGHQLQLSVSMGVAMWSGDCEAPEELVRQADTAMYRAKAEGRRCYHFYEPEMDEALQERMEMDQAMRIGLERGEFYLVYQPRVDLVTGDVLSMEALVRWRHPEWGVVSPRRFIPRAEETGFILLLGPEILRQACSRIRAWKERSVPTVPVAVNLSARELRDPEVIDRILGIMADKGLEAGELEIEITESAAMGRVDQTARMLGRLNEHGVRISIDDFGTAYSSLNYLKRLPVHAIKIDQSFISDMEGDAANHPEDAAIIRAIIGLGDNLGMQVIAEGIENQVQRDFLLDSGCLQGQGYLFSYPMLAEDVESLVVAPRGAPAGSPPHDGGS